MTVEVSQDTLRTAAAFKEAVAGGVDPYKAIAGIADTMGLERGVIRSRLRRQGLWGQPDFDKTTGRVRAGLRDADCDRLIPPTEPVDRDPCQRCGVRHDIGCKHSRVPLGMVL